MAEWVCRVDCPTRQQHEAMAPSKNIATMCAAMAEMLLKQTDVVLTEKMCPASPMLPNRE